LGFFVKPWRKSFKKVCQGFLLERIKMEYQRVVTFLNRQEIDFLDKLGKDALFSCGSKISRAKILSWLVDFLKKLGIDGNNLKSEMDLEEKVYKKLKEILDEEISHRCLPLIGQAEIK